MNKLERRYIAQRFTVEGDETPKIRGYAAVFNSPSEDMGFVEYIDAHAFDETLTADVRALFNHDANLVLGRTTAGTLRLTVDEKGLAYEIDPPDTQYARDLMVSMKRGDVSQSSFGFYCLEDDWKYEGDKAIRTIIKAALFDVSPVTYPAYSSTSSEARSFPEGVPESVQKHLRGSNECECDCPECQDGDCPNCSEDPCDCENCDCNQYRAMVMKVKLAEAF